MANRQDGPSLRDMALIIVTIFALGFVALALFGCQTSRILSNVSGPI